MCGFVCGTMSHAKLSFNWSVILYRVTLEWHFGCGFETSTGWILRKRMAHN